MDAIHELLTGEHMPVNYYLYTEMLKHNMIHEKFVPKEVVEYRALLNIGVALLEEKGLI